MALVPLQLITYARSDPGRDPTKQVNEDAFCLCNLGEGLLAVVCDGMGGHLGGRLASSAAVQVIEQQWRARIANTEARQLLVECIQKAATEVYALGGATSPTERPGTTCVAAWFSSGLLQIAHAGDSRAYRLRNGQLVPLTVDHSMVEAWVSAGQLTREQAKGHPDAHRITRALGISPEIEVELRPSEDLRNGDRLLLCSDGLTDLVSNEELAQHLAQTEPLERIGDRLIALANQRGGHDNITAVLVEVRSAGAAAHVGHETLGIATPLLDHTEVIASAAPRALPKTVPIESVSHTVLMDNPMQSGEANRARPAPFIAPAGRAPELRPPVPQSVPPALHAQRRARHTLWLVLALACILSALAVLVRFLRHKGG